MLPGRLTPTLAAPSCVEAIAVATQGALPPFAPLSAIPTVRGAGQCLLQRVVFTFARCPKRKSAVSKLLWKLQIHPQLGNNSVNTSTTLQTQSTGGANPSHPLCICKLIPTVRKCIPGTDTLQTHPQCGTLANAVCVCKSRRILQNHPLHFFCKPIPVWRSTCKTGPNRKYQPQGAVNFANLYPVG